MQNPSRAGAMHDVRGTRMRTFRLALSVGALTMTGCTVGADVAGADRMDAVERDSAGVRIVESVRPRSAGGDACSVDPVPVLRIGVVDGPAEYQFDRVRAVRILADGALAVADEGSGRIRIFDARGRQVRAFGGRGEGPGEFPQLSGVWVTNGDTLYAQAGHVGDGTRFHVITRDGALVRSLTIPFDVHGGDPQLPQGVLQSGTILSASSPQPTRSRRGRWQDSSTFLRHGADGRVLDTLARLPAYESARELARVSHPVVFGPTLRTAMLGDSLVVGYPDRYELRILAPDGRVARIVRRAWTPVPVTEAHRASYRAGLVEREGERGRPVSPRVRQQRRELAADAVFAERFPAFGLVRVATDGHLWIAEPEPDDHLARALGAAAPSRATRWTVLDASGRWLCAVELPAGFEPLDFGGDRVVGLWRDENDVDHVRVHAIRLR